MSDWGYIAIAYTVVWGSIALYALVMARRVTQARELARALRQASETEGYAAPASEAETGNV